MGTPSANTNSGMTLTISNFKFEKGDRATDWTPAPEDESQMVKIDTASRAFTTANWKTYGAVGHSENWTTGSSYDNSRIKVGDTAYLVGTVTDGVGGTATIIGTVTAVNGAGGSSSITMTSTQLIFGGDSVDAAAKTATNYIAADSTGIKIHKASDTSNYLYQTSDGTKIYKGGNLKANYADTITLYGGNSASGANPKIILGESITDGGTARQSLCFYDNSGNRRLKINAGVGLIIGLESKGHTQITDAGVYFYDTNNKKRTQVDANGLTIYDASATPVDVANFGTSVGTTGTTAFARIGLSNSTRFEISPTTLSAYTGNTKYFEVSASGLQYGSGLGNTAATTTNVNSAKAEAIRIAGTSKTNLIAYNPDPANMLASVYTGQAKTSYPLYAMSNSANTGSQGRQFVQNYTNNTASSKYLMLCPFSPNEFAPGDVIEFKGRGANWDSAITTAKLVL